MGGERKKRRRGATAANTVRHNRTDEDHANEDDAADDDDDDAEVAEIFLIDEEWAAPNVAVYDFAKFVTSVSIDVIDGRTSQIWRETDGRPVFEYDEEG